MQNLNSKNLKSKFSFILLAYNLMIGYSKKNRENYPGVLLTKRKQKPALKFNPALAITGVRTTGPRWECSKQKFVFHFFKAIFEISFRPSRPFFGKQNWLVQMVNAIRGRNLSFFNFAYHLPKPWTYRLSYENGKQPTSSRQNIRGKTTNQLLTPLIRASIPTMHRR